MQGDRVVINVFAMMGGIVLRIPEDWAVVSNVTALLGGVDDKTRPLVEPVGTLVLEGSAIMGAWSGLGWEWINLGFLFGGLYLLYKKIIAWHIPVGLLVAMAVWAVLFYDGGSSLSGGSRLLYPFNFGGTLNNFMDFDLRMSLECFRRQRAGTGMALFESSGFSPAFEMFLRFPEGHHHIRIARLGGAQQLERDKARHSIDQIGAVRETFFKGGGMVRVHGDSITDDNHVLCSLMKAYWVKLTRRLS